MNYLLLVARSSFVGVSEWIDVGMRVQPARSAVRVAQGDLRAVRYLQRLPLGDGSQSSLQMQIRIKIALQKD